MSNSVAPAAPAPLVTTRLSIMMFLEFAVWGSWAVLIGGHMNNLGFSATQIGYVYLTTALGAMLSPFIAGYVADRLMPSQLFTALVHLAGGAMMYMAWSQKTFEGMFLYVLLHAVLYMPTIALTNAISFHHMKDSRKFGFIRVWGTLGWIAINWAMSAYLKYWEKQEPGVSHVGDAMLAAAILSGLMGLYCLTLPHTPPAKNAANPYAFLEAFKLTSNRNFAILLVISFIVAIELPFYYNYTFMFLTDAKTGVGLPESEANFAMSLGQLAEVVLMLLLTPALRHLGMRTTVLLGILAWPLRYGIFALGGPPWLIIAAQCLHGICYSFFFVAGMIAVERLSHKDIRASAQGLLIFATNGFGMLIGSLLSGYVVDYFKKPEGGHAWAAVFMVPIAITVVAGIVFAFMFDERKYQADSTALAGDDSAEARCAACNYDLRGTRTGFCPVCGRPVSGTATLA